jgi:hypothetical protein
LPWMPPAAAAVRSARAKTSRRRDGGRQPARKSLTLRQRLAGRSWLHGSPRGARAADRRCDRWSRGPDHMEDACAMSRVFSLLVGINDQAPEVGRLAGCLNDVDHFHDHLKRHVDRAGDTAVFHCCGHAARWASTAACPNGTRHRPPRPHRARLRPSARLRMQRRVGVACTPANRRHACRCLAWIEAHRWHPRGAGLTIVRHFEPVAPIVLHPPPSRLSNTMKLDIPPGADSIGKSSAVQP